MDIAHKMTKDFKDFGSFVSYYNININILILFD